MLLSLLLNMLPFYLLLPIYSDFSLEIILIGVPTNPNSFLIWLTKYLSYEKWNNSLLLTNITNVGGFVLT